MECAQFVIQDQIALNALQHIVPYVYSALMVSTFLTKLVLLVDKTVPCASDKIYALYVLMDFT